MLILSRMLEESIMINDVIEIKIVRIEGKKVKLGFTCPSNIIILRKEIYAKSTKCPDRPKPDHILDHR